LHEGAAVEEAMGETRWNVVSHHNYSAYLIFLIGS
jgi:hypothetical protein